MRRMVTLLLLLLATLVVGPAPAEARPSWSSLRSNVEHLLPERGVPRGLRRDGPGYVLRDPAWKKGARFSTVRPLLERLPQDWQVAVQSSQGSFFFQPIGVLLSKTTLDPGAVLKDGRVYRPRAQLVEGAARNLSSGRRQLIVSEEYFDGQQTVRRYYEPGQLAELSKRGVVAARVIDLPSLGRVERQLSRLRPGELVYLSGTLADQAAGGAPGARATQLRGVYSVGEARQLLRDKVLLEVPRLSRVDGRQAPRAARWTLSRPDRRPLWGRGRTAPRPESVRQGRLGDCWLLSRVAAVARANPGYVESMIRTVGQGRYEVRLHVRTEAGRVEPRWIPVSRRTPRLLGLWTYYARGADGPWVSLIEQAAAKVAGSYAELSGHAGGSRLNGYELLLGSRGQHLVSKDLGDRALLETIRDALRGGQPVTTGSSAAASTAQRRHRIVPDHAYAISGVDLARGTIELQNPWGHQHVKALPVAEFKQLYPAFQIGQIPGR